MQSALKVARTPRKWKDVITMLIGQLIREDRKVNRDDVDADLHTMGLPNGQVLDLKLATAECSVLDVVRDRTAEDVTIKKLGVDVPTAAQALEHRRNYPEGKDKTPAQQFIEAAFPDPVERRWAQKLWGYSLLGGLHSQKNRVIPVFIGDTSNGKSTLLNLIRSVMGDYLGEIGIEALTGSDDKPNSRLLEVIKCRMVVMSELSETDRGASARLKAMSGGESVSATGKYKNYSVSSTTMTPSIITNEAPSMAVGPALKVRLKVIPMNVQSEVLSEVLNKAGVDPIQVTEPNGTITTHPRRDVCNNETHAQWFTDPENQAYMLEWLVQGYAMTLTEPHSDTPFTAGMEQALKDFCGAADPREAWLSELDYVEQDTGAALLRGNFEEIVGQKISYQKLEALLASRGVQKVKTKAGMAYRGVAIPGDDRLKVSMIRPV